jgi:type IV pilus assembly protein PilA
MFIKMRESKGFTLVELMIVVAIIGILAAVAVPYYQRYIQKSRLTSLVIPGMHAIQTDIAAFYALNNSLTIGTTTFNTFVQDANTVYFTPTLCGATTPGGFTISLLAKDSGGTGTNPLYALRSQSLTVAPNTAGNTIGYWQYSGSLATLLGLQGVQ